MDLPAVPRSPARPVPGAPARYARIAGLLYAFVIVAGVFAEVFVRSGVFVAGDPARTAHNILAHALRYRLGFAAELLALVCNVPLTLILYELFKVVSRRVSLLMVFFSLVGTAIEGSVLLDHLAPLTLLDGSASLSAIPVAQLQAQAYVSLQLFELGFAVCLVFFGFFCLATGYLIVRSRFVPWLVGVLLALEGACYLLNSFTDFLAPAYASRVLPILEVSAIGEISLCLWLLVMGVNVAKWSERARLAADGG